MELTEKVLTVLKLCQTLECAKCSYLNEVNDCQFQLLARDAENVIKKLVKINEFYKNQFGPEIPDLFEE